VRRQRGRQVAPCGHNSTVGQRFLRPVLRDGQQRRSTPRSGLAADGPVLMVLAEGPAVCTARRARPGRPRPSRWPRTKPGSAGRRARPRTAPRSARCRHWGGPGAMPRHAPAARNHSLPSSPRHGPALPCADRPNLRMRPLSTRKPPAGR
jgi:hypothetical protein